MENQDSPSGGCSAQSGAARAVPGAIKGVETGAGLEATSPRSSQPSRGVEVPNAGRKQHPGEVAGHSLGHCRHLDGLGSSSPGTSVFRASVPVPGGPVISNSGNSAYSGSSSVDSCKTYENQPRGILKNNSPTLTRNSSATERKKSQHWDEMNIMATYHPTDKNYGFMKVDEPSTPYRRLNDSDEDMTSESSKAVTPGMLTERLATVDSYHPKVLQYGDNRSSGSSDSFSKTYSNDFDKRRKAHYDEGKFLKAQKNLSLDSSKSSNGGTPFQDHKVTGNSLNEK